MSVVGLLAERARLVADGGLVEVPSPCISVCRMDPVTQWCEGCFRTLDEIAAWSGLAADEKKQVWQTIALRLPTP
ncbi:DUF1289 domain-containing protein [Caenimonas sp. SL110]|uniref:DUF1289 domain-containing protein n=1 Tax=Caenimonas sp. SL110 TaxID=1450524 RepID=UPI0009E357CD|nr:DUF1289 domain-containing protein [Caenimonas sp. SL110]